MKKYSLVFCLLFISISAFAQKTTISGVITDNENSEPLIGAYVLLDEELGAITDFDGKYSFEVKNGEHTIGVSYVGYEEQSQTVSFTGGNVTMDFVLSTKALLQEIVVVADVAIQRETPVAFSNIDPITLEQELASQDLPMVLNSTPGVYATNQGGGDGDARITIRGFSQRNVAVMLDGIPVNDMENGQVYWSNWFGLDVVTKTMQVQRGLGASKLAIPSVGGTINILTKGIDSKRNVKLKQEVGNNGFLRTTLGYNSGRLASGWGVSAALSYKRGNGWVNGNFTEGAFYYLKVEKEFNKHLFSFSTFGAPQKHGQRSFTTPVQTVDAQMARNFFEGTDEQYQQILSKGQIEIRIRDITSVPALLDEEELATLEGNLATINQQLLDQGLVDEDYTYEFNNPLIQSFIDTTGAGDYGYRHNQHVAQLNGEQFNASQNQYYKPTYSLRHSWNPNKRFFLSNVAYYSYGRGGGIAASSNSRFQAQGEPYGSSYELQRVYDDNQLFGESANVLRSSVNNHNWYGLLSTARYELSPLFDLSAGVDLRSYEGEHYRQVHDLFGATAFNEANQLLQVGDIFDYNYTGFVQWGGVFGLLELSTQKFSAFVNLSAATVGYSAENYFKERAVTLSDTVLYVAENDTITYQDKSYHANSPEASFQKLDPLWIPGFTVKTGGSYRMDKSNSVFFNVGYLSKAQRFTNVLLPNNFTPRPMEFFAEYENEKITAFELGYNFKNPKLALNVNLYRTQWINKPVDRSPSRPDPERCVDENGIIDPDCDFFVTVNIQGIEAVHQGVEMDFAYNIHPKVKFEGLVSVGDWRWTSSAVIDLGAGVDPYEFDATGVKVGDAAQTQISGMLNIKPIKGWYVKLRGTYFGDNYANFNPEDLKGVNARRQSWKMPAYLMFDFHTGYSFKVKDTRMSLRFSLLNALNTKYIADAQNNDGFWSSSSDYFFNRTTFGANSATVHFGQGRRWNTSFTIDL